MMMGAVHSFPVVSYPGRDDRAQAFPSPSIPRFWSEVQALGPQEAENLLGTTKNIIQKSRTLVDYVDRNRREARRAGVETIGIQLSLILESGRLDGVRTALEEGIRTGTISNISLDGFSRLRRAEHLVAEADRSIAEYVETPVEASMGSSCSGHHCSGHGLQMGAAGLSTPMMILAVVGAGAILTVVILALVKK